MMQDGIGAVQGCRGSDTRVRRGVQGVQRDYSRGDTEMTQAEAMSQQDEGPVPEAIAAATAIAA